MDSNIENFNSGFDLVGEISKMAGNPPIEVKRDFFNIIRSASYIVPCKTVNHSELNVLNNNKGESLLPLFTDYSELKKWPFSMEDAAVIPYDKLKTIVIDKPDKLAGLVINPFGASLVLHIPQLQEIDAVTTGFSYEKTQYQGMVKYMPLFVSTQALADKLSVLFDSFSTVYRAFAMLAQAQTELVPHLLILVDFSGDKTALFPRIAQILQPFLKKGDRFELTKADIKTLTAAENTCNPIYVKK